MSKKKIIRLPEELNPEGLLTIKKAAQVSGLPESTIRNYRKKPGNCGVRFYRIGGRLYLKANEFVQWINVHAKAV